MVLLFTRFPITAVYRQFEAIGHSCICKARKPSANFQFRKASSDSKSTVDAKEVDHHTKLKDEWWDPIGKMKALHSMNTIRVPFIKNGLVNSGVVSASAAKTRNSLKDLKILDVGCGGGILAEPLASIGATVTGIDPSSELISIAETHASLNPITKNIRYISCSIDDHIKDHEDFYDAVIASEVIEHVVNPDVFIKSCVTALKPGGSIFLTTPNQTYLSWLCGIVIAEDILNIVPKGTHSHDKFVPAHQLQQLLEKNHCRTVQVSGLFYNVLTNAWSWIPFKGFLYAMHAVKLPS